MKAVNILINGIIYMCVPFAILFLLSILFRFNYVDGVQSNGFIGIYFFMFIFAWVFACLEDMWMIDIWANHNKQV